MLKLKATDRCAGIDFGLRTFASLYEVCYRYRSATKTMWEILL